MIGEIMTLLYLWVNAREDVRKKEVAVWSVVVYMAVGIYCCVFRFHVWERLLLVLVSASVLGGISVMTKGGMGGGDVLILSSLGMMLDFYKFLLVFGLGLFAAAFYGGILFLLKKVGRKEEIPFIPFLLLGYTGGLCVW